jgi:hypothetical protein
VFSITKAVWDLIQISYNFVYANHWIWLCLPQIIWGSHGGEDVDVGLLFITLSGLVGRTNVSEKQTASIASALKIEAVCSTEPLVTTSPHGIKTQKTKIDIATASPTLEHNTALLRLFSYWRITPIWSNTATSIWQRTRNVREASLRYFLAWISIIFTLKMVTERLPKRWKNFNKRRSSNQKTDLIH